MANDQIFFMPNKMRRRIHGKWWKDMPDYLSALEPKDEKVKEIKPFSSRKDLDQIKGQLVYLQNKVNSILDKKKKRTIIDKYKNNIL